jgi:tetratricopeptide (TPR) repeat protein
MELAEAAGTKLDASDLIRLANAAEKLADVPGTVAALERRITAEPALTAELLKKIIRLQRSGQNGAGKDLAAAEASLARYEQLAGLSPEERIWAMVERSGLLMDRDNLDEAWRVAEQAEREMLAVGLTNDEFSGTIAFRKGFVAWRKGQDAVAAPLLQQARSLLGVASDLEGEATYLLGRMEEARGDATAAARLYDEVLLTHPDSRVARLARLGRGVTRLMQNDLPGAMGDFQYVARVISDDRAAARPVDPDTVGGSQQAFRTASLELEKRGQWKPGLEVLGYEQTVTNNPGSDFFTRLARLYTGSANEAETMALAAADPSTREKLLADTRDLRTKAGDALIGLARSLEGSDDPSAGQALWDAAGQFDCAGNNARTITSLERFINQRPDDPLAPEALLRLGRTYQAVGLNDQAIAALKKNQGRYPNTLAASKSLVPLAQAYTAKGADYLDEAESTLLQVVEDNPVMTPAAEEFKVALMELSQLYHQTGRWDEASLRADEIIRRYPDEPRLGRIMFLSADSQRKAAIELGQKVKEAQDRQRSNEPAAELASAVMLATAPPSAAANANSAPVVWDVSELKAQRRDRLNQARAGYDRTIERYRQVPPSDPLETLQQKLAHFYRADCVFDMEDFEQAIKLYDTAALRYQDDATSLTAHVQIVNAYVRLGKLEEARAANERAKWLVKRMPDAAFTAATRDGSNMTRQAWEKWIAWSEESGLLAGSPATPAPANPTSAGSGP